MSQPCGKRRGLRPRLPLPFSALCRRGWRSRFSGPRQPCKTITTKILSATNARFEQFSELGTRVLFEHPSARDLSLLCTSPNKIGVFVRWDAADPPAAFFDLATKAGVATTGEIMSTLGMAIRNCHRAALQGRTEFAATETPMSKIECQAFTREGGGTAVSVWVK
jgi:hypothetical protein